MRSTRLPTLPELQAKTTEIETSLLEPTRKKNADGQTDFAKLDTYIQESLTILDTVDQSLKADESLDDEKKAAALAGAHLLVQEKLTAYYKKIWSLWGVTNDPLYKQINSITKQYTPYNQLQALLQLKLHLPQLKTDGLTDNELATLQNDLKVIDNLLAAAKTNSNLHSIESFDKKKMHSINRAIKINHLQHMLSTEVSDPLEYFKKFDQKAYAILESNKKAVEETVEIAKNISGDLINIQETTNLAAISYADFTEFDRKISNQQMTNANNARILDRQIAQEERIETAKVASKAAVGTIASRPAYSSQAKLNELDQQLANKRNQQLSNLFKPASTKPEEITTAPAQQAYQSPTMKRA